MFQGDPGAEGLSGIPGQPGEDGVPGPKVMKPDVSHFSVC